MAVKPGFKLTEVGVIPEDWECARISDVAKLESGHTPSRKESSYWNGSIPWVSLFDTEALQGKEIFETAKMVTEEGIHNSSARVLPKGTVVFSRTATVGKTTVMGCEMATSQDFANYICGPKLHNHFLVYLFRSMGRTWKSLMAGSIHNTIYMPVFKGLQIILPPLQEQRAIATALSDMDALLGALERLIAKKRDLKQAVMQQLLTGKTRLPGFQGEWEEKTLGSVLNNARLGGNYSNQDEETEFPLMKMGNLARGHFDLSKVQHITLGVTPEVNHRLCFGDVLLNTRNTLDLVGKVAIWRDEIPAAYFNSNLMRLEFDPEQVCSNQFANYVLNTASVISSLRGLATGTTSVAAIYTRDLMKLKVIVPPLPEQAAIAAVLTDMDAELAALEKRLAKTRALKQGMMQELLTGRTRLV